MLNVILVNFNNSDDTINCVNSIVNENFFLDLEIKIFDNNSIETEKNKLDLFIKNKNVISHSFFSLLAFKVSLAQKKVFSVWIL